MVDYKAMYYHLAGRMAITVEVLEMTTETLESTIGALEGTSQALNALAEKLKLAQQTTEEIFVSNSDDDEETK